MYVHNYNIMEEIIIIPCMMLLTVNNNLSLQTFFLGLPVVIILATKLVEIISLESAGN